MLLVLQQKYEIMGKLNFYTFIVLINTLTLTTTAQINKSLEITGSTLLNNEHVGDYSISVYFDGTRIDSIYTISKEPVKLSLPSNHKFTLLFQKQHCDDKIVIVNTKISSDLVKLQTNNYKFKIELSQTINKNSKDFERNQIAVLEINEKDELLDTSKSYDKFTNKELEIIPAIPNSILPASINSNK